MRISLVIALCSLLASCLKNTDSFDKGPKAEMVIINYVVNNASFEYAFANLNITSVPVPFGSATSLPGALYTKYAAGTHEIRFSSGNNSTNHLVSLIAGKKYSLFIYDTLRNSGVRKLLLQDEILPVDTIAKGRFLQFVPGNDSLTIVFTKSNDSLALDQPYIGNLAITGSIIDFTIQFPPGVYEVKLKRKSRLLYQASFILLPGKVYSFISKGLVNGTGLYKETLTLLQHN
ncbi:MAG: hypothetical protein WKF89_01780 [Chitinophagaceae bacterium]